MNQATTTLLRWFLLKENQPEDDIESLLAALKRGVEKQENDSIDMVTNLLVAGRMAARGTDQESYIERLFVLHEKMARIDLEEKAAAALGNVATILEKPPKSDLEARIKSNLIRKTLAPFENS